MGLLTNRDPLQRARNLGPGAIAVIQALGTIAAQKLGSDSAARSAEEEGKRDRQLTREERLLELIMASLDAKDANVAAEKESQFLAPGLARIEQKRLSAPETTVARTGAMDRYNQSQPGGPNAGVTSLVKKNMQDFLAMDTTAKTSAARYTPEALYTPMSDPLQAVKEQEPSLYMDMSHRQKYSNKPGDGLDDIEVEMLNKAVATGRSPQEISKMLATFRSKDVQQGVKTSG